MPYELPQFKDPHAMTTEGREIIIMQFISKNQGCSAQNIVDGLVNDISRDTIFDIIPKLVGEGKVKDERANRRSHRYYVDLNNPLVSLPNKLNNIEQSFAGLISKINEITKKEIELTRAKKNNKLGKKMSKTAWLNNSPLNLESNESNIFQRLGHDVTLLLGIIVKSCTLYCTHVWPRETRDAALLSKLYTLTFTKIADLYANAAQVVGLDGKPITSADTILDKEFSPIESLIHFKNRFYEIRAKQEIDNLLNSLWDNNKEINPILYPEPLLYDWNFNFASDNWKKLCELKEEHPEQTKEKFVEYLVKNIQFKKTGKKK